MSCSGGRQFMCHWAATEAMPEVLAGGSGAAASRVRTYLALDRHVKYRARKPTAINR